MGRASKWIRNFLLGKKEEKFKKIDTFCTQNEGANLDCQMETPKVKRRWSFGKITGGKTSGKAPKSLPTALAEVSEDPTAAATKIQAAFRSYLARKALHALRGLVKLQALVRGHLVRKQTTTTLRGMHALMAIQVRARINRIQMVEEANLLGKQPQQHREIPQYKGLIKENKDSKDMIVYGQDSKDTSLKDMLEALKSRSGPLDRSQAKSAEHDFMAFNSKRLSVSKRQHQYRENTVITAPNTPENYPAISEFNPTTMALSTSQRYSVSRDSHRQSWAPNYMNKTESSRAKARSQSEPKQRPKQGMKHKNKSVESTKELITSLHGPRQSLFSNSSHFDHGSMDHWAISFYESMESKRNSYSGSTMTSDSYY